MRKTPLVYTAEFCVLGRKVMKKEEFFAIVKKMPKGYNLKKYSWQDIPEKIDIMSDILFDTDREKLSINGHVGKDAIKQMLKAFAYRLIVQETKLEDLENGK